jgi:uncharacterized protein
MNRAGGCCLPPSMIDTRVVSSRNSGWIAWGLLAATLSLVVGLLLPRAALAGGLDIERPGQREFVADHADILDAAAERDIKRLAADLLDEHATSIVVVTIESMAAHGGEHMDIETFARILFDQWGVGHPEIRGQSWNTGILVVISEGDRKARIELGGGWARDKDTEAKRIMDTRMVPAFRTGDYSRGAIDGVIALSEMARSKPLPAAPKPRPWTDYLLICIGIVLAIWLLVAMFVSIVQEGKQAWGWKLIVLIFGLLGALLTLVWAILKLMAALGSSKDKPSSCGELGSFGGGSSGGGGATGEW